MRESGSQDYFVFQKVVRFQLNSVKKIIEKDGPLAPAYFSQEHIF